MFSKKLYLKRHISCDAHLLNELLETDMPWDDAIVVSAGKLRKLWDSVSELRSSLCERRLERTVLRPASCPVKTAQFTQFFRQVWRHTVKSLSLTECIARFTPRHIPEERKPQLQKGETWYFALLYRFRKNVLILVPFSSGNRTKMCTLQILLKLGNY